jgi:hypothetical protein
MCSLTWLSFGLTSSRWCNVSVNWEQLGSTRYLRRISNVVHVYVNVSLDSQTGFPLSITVLASPRPAIDKRPKVSSEVILIWGRSLSILQEVDLNGEALAETFLVDSDTDRPLLI